MPLTRDQVPNATPWVLHVANTPRDQVDVAMKNGLTSCGTCIHADVKTGDGWILEIDGCLQVVEQDAAGLELRRGQAEKVQHMAFGYDSV